MIESISHPSVFTHVLWRDCDPFSNRKDSQYIELRGSQMSLSRARNVLISNALEAELIEDDDVVCFADDDGLWPLELPTNILKVFNSDLYWALGVYFPLTRNLDQSRFPSFAQNQINHEDILMRASSLGLYMKGIALKQIGKFNEYLGIGGTIHSGEDTEYALRLHFKYRDSNYNPSLFQYHEYGSELNSQRIESSLRLIWYLYFMNFVPISNPLRRTISLMVKRKTKIITFRLIYTDWKNSKRDNKNFEWYS